MTCDSACTGRPTAGARSGSNTPIPVTAAIVWVSQPRSWPSLRPTRRMAPSSMACATMRALTIFVCFRSSPPMVASLGRRSIGRSRWPFPPVTMRTIRSTAQRAARWMGARPGRPCSSPGLWPFPPSSPPTARATGPAPDPWMAEAPGSRPSTPASATWTSGPWRCRLTGRTMASSFWPRRTASIAPTTAGIPGSGWTTIRPTCSSSRPISPGMERFGRRAPSWPMGAGGGTMPSIAPTTGVRRGSSCPVPSNGAASSVWPPRQRMPWTAPSSWPATMTLANPTGPPTPFTARRTAVIPGPWWGRCRARCLRGAGTRRRLLASSPSRPSSQLTVP